MRNLVTKLSIVTLLVISQHSFASDTYQVNLKDNVAPTNTYKPMSMPLSNDISPELGMGYSSDANEFITGECVYGDKTYVGSPSGQLSVINNISQKELSNELDFGGEIDVGMKFLFSANAKADLYYYSQDSDYSQTLTTKFEMNLKDRNLKLPKDESPLTLKGKTYASNPYNFREYCGDKFVSQQKIGGRLYITSKFKFESQRDKAKFSSELGGSLDLSTIAGLPIDINAKSHFADTLEKIGKRGNIEIRAVQYGGNTTLLSTMLAGSDGRVSTMSCSLQDINACQGLLQNLLSYAANPQTGFPAQFNIDDEKQFYGPAVLATTVTPYQNAGIVVDSQTKVSKEVKDNRRKLVDLLTEQSEFRHNIEGLLNNRNLLPSAKTAELKSNLTLIERDIEDIKEAGLSCYDDIDNCSANVASVGNTIHKLQNCTGSQGRKNACVLSK